MKVVWNQFLSGRHPLQLGEGQFVRASHVVGDESCAGHQHADRGKLGFKIESCFRAFQSTRKPVSQTHQASKLARNWTNLCCGPEVTNAPAEFGVLRHPCLFKALIYSGG